MHSETTVYHNLNGRISSSFYNSKCGNYPDDLEPSRDFSDGGSEFAPRLLRGSLVNPSVRNDTGAVLIFRALKGGVSPLQILDNRQQPSSSAQTRLCQMNVAFCAICGTEGAAPPKKSSCDTHTPAHNNNHKVAPG